MAQELLARFRSKEDFISYMSNQLQLYVPPEKMLNRDFMKQLLVEDKKLLELCKVIHVTVPRFDELSVKKFWPLMQQDPAFMQYMPDPTAGCPSASTSGTCSTRCRPSTSGGSSSTRTSSA